MEGKARHTGSGLFAVMSSCFVDPGLFKFIEHYGVQEVNKFFSDCTTEETREAFAKMISDFNSKPLIVDEEDEDDDDEDEDEDNDVNDEGEEDEANGKARKLFGDTKRASLVKRLLAHIGDELEPKKPRIAESSCVHADKTEAAGIKDSSLQA